MSAQLSSAVLEALMPTAQTVSGSQDPAAFLAEALAGFEVDPTLTANAQLEEARSALMSYAGGKGTEPTGEEKPGLGGSKGTGGDNGEKAGLSGDLFEALMPVAQTLCAREDPASFLTRALADFRVNPTLSQEAQQQDARLQLKQFALEEGFATGPKGTSSDPGDKSGLGIEL